MIQQAAFSPLRVPRVVGGVLLQLLVPQCNALFVILLQDRDTHTLVPAF